MKHEYTDTQLQAAIDGACLETHREHRGRVGSNLVIDTDAMPSVYAAEASARLDLIKSALAELPEPEPLTVDGKTPGQVAWDAGNEVQKRKFPNEPVMLWQEGDELHEQLEVAAAAVLAAFGNQSHADEPTPEPLVTKPISLPTWTPEIGDVVTLKSGGPKMTIRAFDRDDPIEAWCQWFKDEKSCAETFPTACLQPA